MGAGTANHLEGVLGALAVHAAAAGTRRFVVAGGETSGAVVSALGIQQVLVEDELEAGVGGVVDTARQVAVSLGVDGGGEQSREHP